MCDLDGPLEMLDVHAACFCDLVVDLHALANIFDARDAEDDAGEDGEAVRGEGGGDVDVVVDVTNSGTLEGEAAEEFFTGVAGTLQGTGAEQGVKHIVLGSFGTGVFKNKVDTVAGLWADLIYKKDARFKNSFEKVVFAVPGKLLNPFRRAFGTRELIERVSDAVVSDTMEE